MAGSVDKPNLPHDYYGGFDVRHLPDGSKEYALPHTADATAWTLLCTGKATMTITALGIFLRPFSDNFLVSLILAVLAVFVAIRIWVEVTGYRAVTYIGIRTDGLVWDRTHFYPRAHIMEICYGTTARHKETGEERFTPKLEIQVGVHTLVLAEDLELAAARLFENLFREDTRRYWYGHN